MRDKKRWWHRWELRAVAMDSEDVCQQDLADSFNNSPIRFVFRASAKKVVRLFEFKLELPLYFYVVQAEATKTATVADYWDVWGEDEMD